ncbi:MAG: sigma-54-dependent Fis family transcriptional regulator [Mucilaginibacter polytrichastri]|nr:sigma-54-dependent Fis family transcriptional regulator [Mucilaginibacter polytrichastri]
MKRILIIDDEVNVSELLSRFLSRHGFDVHVSINGAKGLEQLSALPFDLVLCDFRLDDTDGREILKTIRKHYPHTGVIIITGYSDIKIAVELIKLGAYDYITKPLYPDEILTTINKALETLSNQVHAPAEESVSAQKQTGGTALANDFVLGSSRSSRELMRQIELVAPTKYSVIIMGESGTGKESVAKSIHMNSPRRNKPFVAMDCGSLTKELAGSEFFGHEKGSFTGAMSLKIGHFELANGGTLFLDEVGNLSYETQAALLRIVQERKLKRIGGTKEIDLDVRIIVATNESLSDAITKGRFREDLYHRFNEFTIYMPPLRERSDDIMLLATHFLEASNAELNRNVNGFSADVTNAFMAYKWPGNIRELKNVIKRATLLSEGDQITMKALPLEISNAEQMMRWTGGAMPDTAVSVPAAPTTPKGLKNAALEAENEAILKVLREVNYNKTKAAQVLNIDRKTLYNKMRAIKNQNQE